MSAEKEIVNYWYNRKGFFTINNIKAGNRDCGLLALKLQLDNSANEIFHIEVSCSLTNNIAETTDLGNSIGRIVKEKFEGSDVTEAISSHIRQFPAKINMIKRVIVLGAVPKSRKGEITTEFNQKNVEVIEFENILYDVMEQLDTQYHKNDIIRTLQLTKFMLISEPAKLAKFLANGHFSPSSRKEFLSSILNKDEIIKEFKKTNVERLAAILKNSGLKPSELAHMLEHDILNKKTRKAFFDSLAEQEKIRKVVNKLVIKKKMEMELERFF